MRQARHRGKTPGVEGAFRLSPQREQHAPLRTGNSAQQASQIGTEERRGKGEPQSAQNAGRRAQLKLSMGLRSTRATARHLIVSDGGIPLARMPKSLWKTHLAYGQIRRGTPLDAPSIAHLKCMPPDQPGRNPESNHRGLAYFRGKRSTEPAQKLKGPQSTQRSLWPSGSSVR
jgi:hypothetical protein